MESCPIKHINLSFFRSFPSRQYQHSTHFWIRLASWFFIFGDFPWKTLISKTVRGLVDYLEDIDEETKLKVERGGSRAMFDVVIMLEMLEKNRFGVCLIICSLSICI